MADVDEDTIPNAGDFDADGDGIFDGFTNGTRTEGTNNVDGDCFPAFLDVDDSDPCVPARGSSGITCNGATDTDVDGISDADETTRGSNANDPDSDGDGLWDTVEILDAIVLEAASVPNADDLDCDNLKNWNDTDSDGDVLQVLSGGGSDHDERRLNSAGADARERDYLNGEGALLVRCLNGGPIIP